jgi:HAD superfamily hydrolase (TIGR01484 family)
LNVSTPIKLISTDFDGTLHTDWENPPVPKDLEFIIGELQKRGAKWVINTGRELGSLMETLTRAGLSIRPDFVVVVEREIYALRESDYVGVDEWNQACAKVHAELFEKVRPLLPEAQKWISSQFKATVYEDPYSPFCLIAECTSDAEKIHEFLEVHYSGLEELTVVRNDIYARFSHKAYNKGTALAEITRRLGIGAHEVLAAGDHLNDLPMLSSEYARWLVAPVNAIQKVKDAVLRQNGHVSDKQWGHGVAHGLRTILATLGVVLDSALHQER